MDSKDAYGGSSMGRITSILLDEKNYSSWATSMKVALAGRNKLSWLTGGPPLPKPTDNDDKKEELVKWSTEKYMVLGWIQCSMEPRIFSQFMRFEDISELWSALQRTFGHTRVDAQIFGLFQDIASAVQGERSVQEYFTYLQERFLELNDLEPLSALETVNDIALIRKQRQRRETYQFLMGLRPEFESTRAQIVGMSPLPDLLEAYSVVAEHAKRLQRQSCLSGARAPSSLPTEQMALAASYRPPTSGSRRRGRGSASQAVDQGSSGGRGSSGPPGPCSHCGRLYHDRSRCYQLYPHLRGSERAASGGVSRPTAASAESTGLIDSSLGATTPDFYQMMTQFQQFQKFQQSQPSTSASASTASSGTPLACSATTVAHSMSPWVIDSGATDHMTGTSSHLHQVIPCSPRDVRLADGSITPIISRGTVSLSPHFSLDSVLLVPQLTLNLLSVSRLTHTLNCSVTFFSDRCVFQDLRSGKTIATGYEKSGMYYLELPHHTAAATVCPPARPATSSSLSLSSLWHARLGHASPQRMLSVCPDVSFVFPFRCDVCELSKHTRSVYVPSVSRATTCFELVHSDVWGPAPVVSFDGFSYFVTFIDDYSRCLWVYLLKCKSEVFSVYSHFARMIQTQYNKSVQILRSDNGGEYTSRSFDLFLRDAGTIHQFSCPGTPEQNGVAERKNRHLLDSARCLLRGMHVPKSYWSAALLTAAFLINRTPSRPLGGVTPYSLLHPSLSAFPIPLRVFGCVCFVQDRRPSRTKLDDRATRCLFLGYSTTSKGYRCYDPHLRRILYSMDVTFHEEVPFFPPHPPSPDLPSIVQPLPLASPPSEAVTLAAPPALLTYSRRRPRSPPSTSTSPPVPDQQPLLDAGTSLPSRTSPSSDDLPIALRKGTRTCVRSSVTEHPLANVVSYQSFSPSYQAFVAAADSVRIPSSTADALRDPQWVKAMQEEMSALHRTGTWSLVSLPPGKRPVGCKWVYTVKYTADGAIDRYKARLVAKGFTQSPDQFGATFAPVAKLTTVRLLLSLAASRIWPLFQLDVKNAFLHGDLQEEVYMAPPPGFALQGEYSGRVCRLHKSLYGLKQSPRAWFERFSSVILQTGFTQCRADHTCFIRATPEGRRAIVLVYVDDIILTGDDTSGISEVKATLRSAFEVKDLGHLRYFLGIEVARSRRGIAISQRKYTLDLLRDTGLLGCRPTNTPMDINHRLHAESGDPLSDPSEYQRLVGRLIYLTNTRPDISFSVGVLSQFMHSPRTSHLEAARRVLRYLKRAPGLGLFYRTGCASSLSCFTDADFAGSLTDRRSTTGFCVFHGDHLVSWRSKKQPIVSRSSAESEYRAMAYGVTELVWLRSLLTELGLSLSTGSTLYCDNKSALLLTQDSVLHERTKHIEMDVHFLRDHVRIGTVLPTHVSSADQLADAFTKAVGPTRTDLTISKLGMIDIFAPP